MSKFNPEKLSVEFRRGVTTTTPIISRHYTLTHSDETGDLFLTIGLAYAYDKINELRDEVLGQWIMVGGHYYFYVYLNVDGQFGPESSPQTVTLRDFVFRRELPLTLEAIRYGDRELFSAHPQLDRSPIIVFFMSTNPMFNKIETWGTFETYNVEKTLPVEQVP